MRFSRFKVPLKDDLLFFILVHAHDAADRGGHPHLPDVPRAGSCPTRELGMILLYSAVNVSLVGVAAQGLHRRDPARVRRGRAWSTATRGLQAFRKVVLPQATTGIVATAIFCLIFAWNEYAFAVLLTSGEAQTAPPFIPIIIGEGGMDWPAVAAAGTTLFLIPSCVFTVLLRKHLLRGITFGAVRRVEARASHVLHRAIRSTSARHRAAYWPRWLRRNTLELVACGVIGLRGC
jgi:multiple sugar transport system permease protein